MERVQVLAPEGSIVDSKKEPTIPKEILMKMYETMIAVRLMDQKGLRLQRQGRIAFNIPTTGQEATQTGAVAALEDRDWAFPAYREPGIAMYRGVSYQEIFDHFYGNGNDVQKGRRLPGLFGEKNVNFVNPSAPIGTQIVQAAGAAYAAKYLKDDACSIVFFGDGATSSNDFHSGMNFAGVNKSPCIFFCQNNQWAISVPLSKQTAAKTIADKAIAYGMPGVQVDGNDILAVYEAVKEAADRARRGEGPTLIEAVTYRMGPHTSSDDPTRYRSKEEVDEQRKRDPIARFESYLKAKKLLTDAKIKSISERIDAEMNECIKVAESTEAVPLESMFTDVYQEMPRHLKEQSEELARIKREYQ